LKSFNDPDYKSQKAEKYRTLKKRHGKVKEKRAAVLKELDHKKRTAFYNSQIGKIHKVLVEGKKNAFKTMKGFSQNYVPIHFDAPAQTVNTIVDVQIERVMDKNVFGTVIGLESKSGKIVPPAAKLADWRENT